MKTLSLDNLRKTIPQLERGSIVMNYDLLKTDEYFIGVEEHVRNQFSSCELKVESHVAMTKGLFLMEYYSTFIDYTAMKMFIEHDSKEYVVECTSPEELNDAIDTYIRWGDYYHPYEDYRNATRDLLDFLDEYEDKPIKTIWLKLLELSREYFDKSTLMEGYDCYLASGE